jgi:hypothetical protein
MPEDDEPDERLEDVRAERDALRQELGDLRAWLSMNLKITKRQPDPAGLTTLTVASDREIIAAIERLTHQQ